ncbi:phosphatase PAP2 family protein [Hymenobacter sp. UYCo722]|uniref:phosphatase PAP2 family protein n=1 Tax=Hymenobacter sp. UYCo722 TaxID=3156335 RepID=UPI00339964CD
MLFLTTQHALLTTVKALDQNLLLAINHAHTTTLDALMTFASNRLVWFPAYALLLGWLVYLFRRHAWLLVPLLFAAVGLADSITSRLFKPFFARPRPCHDGRLVGLLHLPDGCGGMFGFLSSHAANSVALTVFLALVLPAGRFRPLKWGVAAWALLLSYSRVYLAAHYPSDVLGGAIVGALLAWLAATLFRICGRQAA